MPLLSLNSYAAVSLAITALVVYQIASVHLQFYPTITKLFSQKLSKIVIVNDGILATVLLGKLLVWLFFGTLEAREEEVSYCTLLYA